MCRDGIFFFFWQYDYAISTILPIANAAILAWTPDVVKIFLHWQILHRVRLCILNRVKLEENWGISRRSKSIIQGHVNGLVLPQPLLFIRSLSICCYSSDSPQQTPSMWLLNVNCCSRPVSITFLQIPGRLEFALCLGIIRLSHGHFQSGWKRIGTDFSTSMLDVPLLLHGLFQTDKKIALSYARRCQKQLFTASVEQPCTAIAGK